MGSQFSFDKHKSKVLNTIMLIVALFIAYKIYNWQSTNTEKLKADIQIETKKNKGLEELVKLEDRLNNYKKQLIRKDSREFMNKINTLAKSSGLTIISIKPKAEELQKDYSKIGFDLTVAAEDYHQIGRFINSIESSDVIYRVDSAELSSKDGDKISVNLVVSSIVYNE